MALLVSLPIALAASTIILIYFFFVRTNRYSLPLVALPLALLPAFPAWFISSYQLIRTFQSMVGRETGMFSDVMNALLESNQSAQLGYTTTLLPLFLLLVLGTVLFLRKEDRVCEIARPVRTYIIVVATAVFLLLAAMTAEKGIRTVTLPLPVIAHVELLNDPDLPLMVKAKETLNLENSSIEKVSEQIADGLVSVAYWSFVMLFFGFGCFVLGWILSQSFSFSRTTLGIGWIFTFIALSGSGIQIKRHRDLEKEIHHVAEWVAEPSSEEMTPEPSPATSNMPGPPRGFENTE